MQRNSDRSFATMSSIPNREQSAAVLLEFAEGEMAPFGE